jgi:hypothetical protein
MASKGTGSQKKYRNAGVSTLNFDGTDLEPGSEFLATLPPEQEMLLLQGGHLELLQDQSVAADRAQAAAADGEEAAETKRPRKSQS